jgi:hypothetical protein
LYNRFVAKYYFGGEKIIKVMKKNKDKINFWANQRLFVVFSLSFAFIFLSSAVFYKSYLNLNFLPADYVNRSVSVSTGNNQSASTDFIEKINKKMSIYEKYIKENISKIAPVEGVGLNIDNICFISEDRVLVFYNNQGEEIISEVVLNLGPGDVPEIVKVFLKVYGGQDYSGGVFGADPV